MIRSEWCADQILRAIDLPADVDTSKVNATLKDGILTIDLQGCACKVRAHRAEDSLIFDVTSTNGWGIYLR